MVQDLEKEARGGEARRLGQEHSVTDTVGRDEGGDEEEDEGEEEGKERGEEEGEGEGAGEEEDVEEDEGDDEEEGGETKKCSNCQEHKPVRQFRRLSGVETRMCAGCRVRITFPPMRLD